MPSYLYPSSILIEYKIYLFDYNDVLHCNLKIFSPQHTNLFDRNNLKNCYFIKMNDVFEPVAIFEKIRIHIWLG